MAAPDKIDPKNLPKGAFKSTAKTKDGHDVILYNGGSGNVYEAYDAVTGEKLDKATGIDNLIDDVVKNNPISQISDFLQPESLTRAGLILLGSALAIAGFAMIISGTKAAQLATNLIPAGRVANVVKKVAS